MTAAERRLLIWCAVMLLRDTPLSSAEADEIDQLIAEVRATTPTRPERETAICAWQGAANEYRRLATLPSKRERKHASPESLIRAAESCEEMANWLRGPADVRP